jgi:hypothetical protein
MSKVTRDNLNTVMDFDHVIYVGPDGTVSDVDGVYCYAELNVNMAGEDEFYIPEGWELLRGYTGQYGYNGPVMHPSEFIGGRLAEDILETPGYYVALVVSASCDYDGSTDCTVEVGCECEPAGWAIAFKPLPDTAEEEHTGHFSHLGGTWYCDTCDSPYCDLA